MSTSKVLDYVEPGHPANTSTKRNVRRAIMISIVSILGYPILLVLYLWKHDIVVSIFTPESKESIKKHPKYKDADHLNRVWNSPVGQAYIRGGLEYQLQEGYCMPSTLRVILKSIPHVDSKDIPKAKPGPSTPEKYVDKLDSLGYTTSTNVFGSEGYEAFMNAIKKSNDPSYRVAVNFLRSPIFGVNNPSFMPHNLLFALAGGHFSVVIGYLEDIDMIAVFDVNHTYGPFLVESKRLYAAVNAHDFQSGKSRAIVVSKINESAHS